MRIEEADTMLSKYKAPRLQRNPGGSYAKSITKVGGLGLIRSGYGSIYSSGMASVKSYGSTVLCGC